jgi:Ser/Thr protein kinase RdoA (MazF antagonist)
MSKKPRVRLERRLAVTALGRYGMRGARLELLSQRFSQVYRVVSQRGEYCLRLYGLLQPSRTKSPDVASTEVRTGAKLRSPEVLRSQALWLSALRRETNLLVPEPIPTQEGSLLGYVSTEELSPGHSRLRWASRRRDAKELESDLEGGPRMSRHFTLMRWVPGRHKTHDFTPEDLSLVGLFMARLHNHAQRYATPEGSVFPRWNWEWQFGESAPLWSEGADFYSAEEMTLFEASAHRVREDLRQLGNGSDAFGLIHGDFILGNVVFDEGRVGIIDFDSCGWGYYLSDLSRIIRSLENRYQGEGRPHGPPLEALQEALLEGYKRERRLPQGYQRYVQTFAVMQEVGAINRQLALLGRRKARGRGWQNPNLLKNAANRIWKLMPPST